MYNKYVFRQDMPIEFIDDFARIFHLKNVKDNSEFTRIHLNINLYFDLLPSLLIYYLPCKYPYLENVSEKGMITIFRQLLRSKNLYLKKNMKVINQHIQTYYYIFDPNKSSVSIKKDIILSFN